ncbi:hypothetical protein [Archaeoglobus neptunius]|uniref:hypothetical protein n=1 Tax=Archaeoglobus neptunius TaxID=2798580 RepID=UPI00192677D7|nr:hypothetical protein [Archaeoglobus neptunius]
MYDRAFVNKVVVAILKTGERIYGVLTSYDSSFFYLSNCCVLRESVLVETDFAILNRGEVRGLASVEKSVVHGVDVREIVVRSVEERGVSSVDWKSVVNRRVHVRVGDVTFDGTFVTVFEGAVVLRDVVGRLGLDEFGVLALPLEHLVYLSAYSERKVYLKVKNRSRKEEVRPISVVSV